MTTMRKIFDRLESWSNVSGIKSYAILNPKGECVATVNIRRTGHRSPNGLTVRAIATLYGFDTTGRRTSRTLFEGKASGGGYDMDSAAMCGLPLDNMTAVHDTGKRWDDQLRDIGFRVIQTL